MVMWKWIKAGCGTLSHSNIANGLKGKKIKCKRPFRPGLGYFFPCQYFSFFSPWVLFQHEVKTWLYLELSENLRDPVSYLIFPLSSFLKGKRSLVQISAYIPKHQHLKVSALLLRCSCLFCSHLLSWHHLSIWWSDRSHHQCGYLFCAHSHTHTHTYYYEGSGRLLTQLWGFQLFIPVGFPLGQALLIGTYLDLCHHGNRRCWEASCSQQERKRG